MPDVATAPTKNEDAKTARSNAFTYQPETIPIIFVPGVMGTRLEIKSSNSKWDPESTFNMLGWANKSAKTNRQQMAWDHPGAPMQKGDDRSKEELERFYAEVVHSFYVKFLQQLHKLGTNKGFGNVRCPVYAAGYDWRQSNADSAKRVGERVTNVMKRETELQKKEVTQFILISHSMGGLVTRSLLKSNDKLSGKLKAILHVVQPAVGAVVFYRRFFTGAISEYDGSGLTNWTIESIMGTSPAEFATLVSSLRGPMELLPTNALHRMSGENWLHLPKSDTRDVYTIYSDPVSPPGLLNHVAYEKSVKNRPFAVEKTALIESELKKRIAEAKAFHDTLAVGGTLYKHPNTWAIYGAGLATDVGFTYNPPPKWMFWESLDDLDNPVPGVEPQRFKEGDGTVPEFSGAALYRGQEFAPNTVNMKNRQYAAPDVEHGGAFKSPVIRTWINDLLKQILDPAPQK